MLLHSGISYCHAAVFGLFDVACGGRARSHHDLLLTFLDVCVILLLPLVQVHGRLLSKAPLDLVLFPRSASDANRGGRRDALNTGIPYGYVARTWVEVELLGALVRELVVLSRGALGSRRRCRGKVAHSR